MQGFSGCLFHDNQNQVVRYTPQTYVEFVRFIGGSGVVVFVVITGSVPLDAVIALTVSGVTGLVVVLVDPDSTTFGTVTGLTFCTVVV